MLVNLIASVLLMALAEPIVRLLFERGEKFTAGSTAARFVCAGLPGAGTGRVFHGQCSGARFLCAGRHQDAHENQPRVSHAEFHRSPACSCSRCAKAGSAIANTVTSAINVGLLLFALRKKLGTLEMASLRETLRPLTLAALLAGVIAWGGWQWWEKSLGHASIALKIGAVFVPAGIAGGVYWLMAMTCKIPAAREMTAFILNRFKKQKHSTTNLQR
jgi:peptidoglycan biosynthesis protein MviN/MurJ (putative lipid II flippase)